MFTITHRLQPVCSPSLTSFNQHVHHHQPASTSLFTIIYSLANHSESGTSSISSAVTFNFHGPRAGTPAPQSIVATSIVATSIVVCFAVGLRSAVGEISTATRNPRIAIAGEEFCQNQRRVAITHAWTQHWFSTSLK